ncbi:hypothetical protein D5047_03860 [Verminephrobacter eiseniae]|nr:hypothetical protein [Verminephrobacter eiseniae]
MSRHRSSVGLRWPSNRIAALHRLPIRPVLASGARCSPNRKTMTAPGSYIPADTPALAGRAATRPQTPGPVARWRHGCADLELA